MTGMEPDGPVIFGMNAMEFASLARRATRAAVRANLRAGIPVTGMVDGKIRTIFPTDPAALRLLQADDDRDESA